MKHSIKTAAFGLRVHSGWAALVAVAAAAAADPTSFEVLDRRRVTVIDPATPGAKQPYHFVRECEIPQAEEHLATCAATAAKLAHESIRKVIGEFSAIGYRVEAAAILMSSARPLPPLAEILASHPMLHTAEGVFFRDAFRRACTLAKLRVEAIRERELERLAFETFGKGAARLRAEIDGAGKRLGPPWTADQKIAAFAGMLALAGSGKLRS